MNLKSLGNEAKAWIKMDKRPDEIIRIVPSDEGYELFAAYVPDQENIGRILFDLEGYWIYDGEVLTVDEQEQVAKFIMNYPERL
jgi:hypothetical protein